MTDKYVSELPKCKLCDNYPVNYHTGAFGVKHHCADKHCTLHNVLFTEEQWRTLMGEPEPASSVPMPKNADQSELMVKAGMMWLEENAPERLKPESAEPAQQWIKCSERMPTSSDADCDGEVWVWCGNFTAKAAWRRVGKMSFHELWMPTGLLKPQPPEVE